MKDYQLYLVVATLVLIDVIIMSTWQLLDPFERKTKLLPAVVSFFLYKSLISFKTAKLFLRWVKMKFKSNRK